MISEANAEENIIGKMRNSLKPNERSCVIDKNRMLVINENAAADALNSDAIIYVSDLLFCLCFDHFVIQNVQRNWCIKRFYANFVSTTKKNALNFECVRMWDVHICICTAV